MPEWLRQWGGHILVVLIGVGIGIGVFLLLRRLGRTGVLAELADKIAVIRAEAKVVKMEATAGKAVALAEVQAAHEETVKKLTEEEREKLVEVQRDPRELSRLLVRAGRRQRRRLGE